MVVTAVAILAAWAAYNLNWIRQRHVFLVQPEVFGEFSNSPPSTFNRRGNTLAGLCTARALASRGARLSFRVAAAEVLVAAAAG